MKIYHREKYNGELPLLLLISCLFDFNFKNKSYPQRKSIKRFLIYIFHFFYLLDLSKKSSSLYTDEDLIKIIGKIVPEKIDKKVLYSITGVSKNTFNKYLKLYFEENDLIGRRKFELTEVYNIIHYWQGEGRWGSMTAKSKKEIANILTNGNYKELALNIYLSRDKDSKHEDKLSPSDIKKLINYFDYDINVVSEELLDFDSFENDMIWVAIIAIIIVSYKKS